MTDYNKIIGNSEGERKRFYCCAVILKEQWEWWDVYACGGGGNILLDYCSIEITPAHNIGQCCSIKSLNKRCESKNLFIIKN